MKIACLHTAESNVAVFESAARELDLPAGALLHEVRADLLAAAETAGGLNADIGRDTASVLRQLCQSADAVLLTCSTLGPVADELTDTTGVPVLRVDAALASQAMERGGKVVVLCAVETTLQPTARLFEKAAGTRLIPADVRIVSGAWARFKAGDNEGYLTAIAAAADRAYDEGADIVALAQASMAGASRLAGKGRTPLTSPIAGLAAAVRSAARD
ncbi:aspartate/glutamate racemase family protein [Rhizobium sp. RM]|uniref:aspartate/glutamate racemase family protein n=1 Tax=Rhizobium sp. RM TaxID=2748079 RepID=UPI00110EC813|nr:Asp/Glu racemase [Rhizobium sp. RM]TMV20655.1 Asp/Glu racemase [Rhizobium sp. Td3]